MRIGYISYRLSGNDGVSLEANHWREILEKRGHTVINISGDYESGDETIPQLHLNFKDARIWERAIGQGEPIEKYMGDIETAAGEIAHQLQEIVKRQKLETIIAANVFSLPINAAAAAGVRRVLNVFKIPIICRNHDYWWERPRYQNPAWQEWFYQTSFSYTGQRIQLSINSLAQHELKIKTGLNSEIAPDCFDFEKNPGKLISRTASEWRKALGINQEKVLVQATRIVPRKNIEAAIELTGQLGKSQNVVLVLAGEAGDEGEEYRSAILNLGKKRGVRIIETAEQIKQGLMNLWDCQAYADLLLYPSLAEGFGNQFLEAVFFGKPVVVNRYPVYISDIEPLGFKVITMNGQVDEKVVKSADEMLNNPDLWLQKAIINREIARENFSYAAISRRMSGWGI